MGASCAAIASRVRTDAAPTSSAVAAEMSSYSVVAGSAQAREGAERVPWRWFGELRRGRFDETDGTRTQPKSSFLSSCRRGCGV
jgi:hypothetical protein